MLATPLPLLRSIGPLVSALSVCNPFTARRIELERELAGALALPGDLVAGEAVPWNEAVPTPRPDRRLKAMLEQSALLMESLRLTATKLKGNDLAHWRELVLFVQFHKHLDRLDAVVDSGLAGGVSDRRLPGHRAVIAELQALLGEHAELGGVPLQPEVVLSLFFQLRRAFRMIHHHLVGSSEAMVRLRGSIWECIFTHDLARYRRSLAGKMDDFSTLVTGPSGSGKELVARALALSSHVPFDPHTGTFTRDFAEGFFALNLSALTPTLVESELFGHRRGAFTGALADRAGWLEQCPPGGTVFLDEIGETAEAIQVKLLRVLQTRGYQRIGETDTRRFAGRIVAATHRDLGRAITEGRLREDFYFRLCADRIETPSLASQIAGSAAELRRLCGWVCARLVPEEESGALADDLAESLAASPGVAYPWPGNFRELEQAARMFLVRRAYRPLARPPATDATAAWSVAFAAGTLDAEAVLKLYCNRMLELTGGNIESAARRLGLDRRTVLARTRNSEA
jgi:DNA-binding NtrC family response regulator